LEIGYACYCEINIIAPACNHWIAINPCVAMPLKEREISFAHFIQAMLLENWIAYEVIGHARGIAADLAMRVFRPEIALAFSALFSHKAIFVKIIQSIFLFHHRYIPLLGHSG
jgi:hypothetical protein